MRLRCAEADRSGVNECSRDITEIHYGVPEIADLLMLNVPFDLRFAYVQRHRQKLRPPLRPHLDMRRVLTFP